MSSNSRAEVVPVVMEPHGNADSLSVVKVYGFTVVVNTEMWKDTPLGIYITPDTIVDTTRPEFSFLASDVVGRTKERIKVKKLRGIVSMGLLIPAPEGAKEGDDYWEELGLERYEPVVESKDSDCVKGPTSYVPKYDIDNFYRYSRLFKEGEPLFAQEKLNGENHRMVYIDGVQYCGSRNLWKKDTENSKWWKAYREIPGVKAFCESNPGYVLWGESYGKVGGFPYGGNDWRFAAFDIMRPDGTFVNVEDLCMTCIHFKIPMAPTIFFNEVIPLEKLPEYAEGKSLLDKSHVREGVVVRPMQERVDPRLGRVILKIVGNGYYGKA